MHWKKNRKHCLLVSFQPQWNVTKNISHITTCKIRKHTKVCSSWLWCVSVGFCVYVCTRVGVFQCFFKNSPELFWNLKTFKSNHCNDLQLCGCACACVCVMSVKPLPPAPTTEWNVQSPKMFIHLCVYAAVKSTNTLINHTKSSKSNVKSLLGEKKIHKFKKKKRFFFLFVRFSSTKDFKKGKNI